MPTKQAAVTAAIAAFIITTFFGVIIYLKTPERTREIIETAIFILMISFGFIFRVLGEPTHPYQRPYHKPPPFGVTLRPGYEQIGPALSQITREFRNRKSLP